MKIYLDPCLDGSDTGAVGKGSFEKDVVLYIALKIQSLLTENYENVEVKMSRTSDIGKSLDQRMNEANSWAADYYLSIKCNASNHFVLGYEDYIHNSDSDSSLTAIYQDIMHTEIMRLNQLIDFGQKKGDFDVLRKTNMPALLTKNGFIDNRQDNTLMKDSLWLQKLAQGHVNGLVKAFNLKRKFSDPITVYKVIAGTFKTKENAEERVDFLRSKDIKTFIVPLTLTKFNATLYRVQAGVFLSRENADKHFVKVKNTGIHDVFIVTDNVNSKK